MKKFENHLIWVKISLFLLFITSFLGLLIRFLPLQNSIPSSYFYGLLQSHSHTGFLGWIFILLYVLLIKSFGSNNLLQQKKTIIILIINSVLISAMTFSFPFDNYGPFSISFLSGFLIFSYYTLIYFYNNIDEKYDNYVSKKFIKVGILFYFLSSIAPWLLAPIIVLGYKKTALYYNDIFLYLHFLYNGFLTFSILGLFYLRVEQKNLGDLKFLKHFVSAFYLLSIGTLLNYSQSLLWNNPPSIVYVIAFLSSILLILGLYYLIKITKFKQFGYEGIAKTLLYVAIISYIIKIGMQFFQSFPKFATLSYMFKGQFIIGYIHLVTLGFVTAFILAISLKYEWIKNTVILRIAIYSFLIGFILTEILLFGQGILLWNGIIALVSNFSYYIFFFSSFLFIGFTLLFIGVMTQKK